MLDTKDFSLKSLLKEDRATFIGTALCPPDFDYASPILDFSIFRGQNRHFCPRLVSFEHQTKA